MVGKILIFLFVFITFQPYYSLLCKFYIIVLVELVPIFSNGYFCIKERKNNKKNTEEENVSLKMKSNRFEFLYIRRYFIIHSGGKTLYNTKKKQKQNSSVPFLSNRAEQICLTFYILDQGTRNGA